MMDCSFSTNFQMLFMDNPTYSAVIKWEEKGHEWLWAKPCTRMGATVAHP